MPREERETALTGQDSAENLQEPCLAGDEQGAANSGEPCEQPDEACRVLDRLLEAHETWFDVTRNCEYGGRSFEGYAEFHSHGEQYVLVKRAKLWEVDAAEYIFFTQTDVLDDALLDELLDFMKTQAVNKVDPAPNHMKSYISLVIVAKQVEQGTGKRVKKAAFHKTYKFGLRGWAELRLCAIDLEARNVLTNAEGKAMKQALEEISGFSRPGKKKARR